MKDTRRYLIILEDRIYDVPHRIYQKLREIREMVINDYRNENILNQYCDELVKDKGVKYLGVVMFDHRI